MKKRIPKMLLWFPALSAPDTGELTRRVRSLNSMLLNAGMVPVQENDELIPLSSWLRWLPMCFDPARDKRQLYTRFSFVQHLANLLPLFGRESGTGHPGVSYFNRGGGMLCWEPLNREDRAQNGHLLLLGAYIGEGTPFPPGPGSLSLQRDRANPVG